MHKKDAVSINKYHEDGPAYCSTCGEQLDEFCFSPEVNDIDFLEQKKKWCETQGRFQGDECSKQFIARNLPPEIPADDD